MSVLRATAVACLLVSGLGKLTQEEVDNTFRNTGGWDHTLGRYIFRNLGDNWVNCADYNCPDGLDYVGQDAWRKNHDLKVKCAPPAEAKNIFSKMDGDMKVDGVSIGSSLLEFCKAKGYTHVGRLWKAHTQDTYWSKIVRENDQSLVPVSTCNVNYLFESARPLLTDPDAPRRGLTDDWHAATFECVKDSGEESECCTKWSGKCFSHRGAFNNFHGCTSGAIVERNWMSSEDWEALPEDYDSADLPDSDDWWIPLGPCEGECGLIRTRFPYSAVGELTEGCRKCCQSVELPVSWNCKEENKPEYVTPAPTRSQAPTRRQTCKEIEEWWVCHRRDECRPVGFGDEFVRCRDKHVPKTAAPTRSQAPTPAPTTRAPTRSQAPTPAPTTSTPTARAKCTDITDDAECHRRGDCRPLGRGNGFKKCLVKGVPCQKAKNEAACEAYGAACKKKMRGNKYHKCQKNKKQR